MPDIEINGTKLCVSLETIKRNEKLKNMKNKIIEAWDRFIYKHAFHTIKRMSVNIPGFSYLMELYIRKWNATNPIPDSLKKATETFFEAMEKHDKN